MEQAISTENPLPTRDNIVSLQESMAPIACELPDAEHIFATGMYGRKFPMPTGMLVVGKIHKHDHIMSLIKGKAIVVSEFGREVLEAGYVCQSPPGVKRVVLALEDCIFLTVHLNPEDTQDLEIIEKDHIEPENFNIEEIMKEYLS